MRKERATWIESSRDAKGSSEALIAFEKTMIAGSGRCVEGLEPAAMLDSVSSQTKDLPVTTRFDSIGFLSRPWPLPSSSIPTSRISKVCPLSLISIGKNGAMSISSSSRSKASMPTTGHQNAGTTPPPVKITENGHATPAS